LPWISLKKEKGKAKITLIATKVSTVSVVPPPPKTLELRVRADVKNIASQPKSYTLLKNP
jgi:hypothetical protein